MNSSIDESDDETKETNPFITKAGIRLLANQMEKLGFNADWFKEKGKSDNKYILINTIIRSVGLIIIGILLFLLVSNGDLDSSSFAILLSVILGSIINETSRSNRAIE